MRKKDKDPRNNAPTESMEYLCTAANDIELAMIRGLLEEEKIFAYARDRESASYLRVLAGYSMYGADVYVEKEDWEKAKNLVDGYLKNDPAQEEYPETMSEEEQPATTSEEATENQVPETDRPSGLSVGRIVLYIVLAILALIVVKMIKGIGA